MKKLALFVGFALISILFQTCREEEGVKMGRVQFAFNLSVWSNPGGRALSDLPEGSILIVSINKATGDPVHTLKELPLTKVDDQYISDPLPLPHGDYSVTDFIVADADREVLYATPKAGSPLASLVEHPLPMVLSINKTEVSDLRVEVVSADEHPAEQFGYATFEISPVEVQSFKLAAYALGENGNYSLTGAQFYILHEGDTVYNQQIQPVINTIFFDSSPDEEYTLVLIQHSYAKYSETFRLNDLYQGGTDNLISIHLKPAFTVVTSPPEIEGQYNARFSIFNDNPSLLGRVTVDWGDGIIEEIDILHECCPEYNHVYSSPGERFISISGDLEAITHLAIQYDNPVRSISLRELKELVDVSIVATSTPQTIDISHNTKLVTAAFGMTWIKSLDVSKNTHLKNLFLVYMTNFSSTSMNQIIADLHQHAHDYNLTEGWITLVDLDGGHIRPLTSESIDKLRDLHDNFSWTIEPDIESME